MAFVRSRVPLTMPSKTLYLHIGLHKTATTHIQHVCADNRDRLQAAGLHYPTASHSLPGHHELPEMIRRRDTRADMPKKLRDWVARLHDDPAPAALVSSENFDLLVASEVAWVAERLRGFRVVVLLGLRNQVERLQSCYAEEAKKFLTTPFGPWLDEALTDRRNDYPGMLELWESAFGRGCVQVLLYEADGDPADALLARCGVDDGCLQSLRRRARRANPSLGARTLELNRRLCVMSGGRLSESDYRKLVAAQVRDYGKRRGWNDEPLRLYTRPMLQRVVDGVAERNRVLEQRLGRLLPPAYFGHFDDPPVRTAEVEVADADLVALVAHVSRKIG